MKISLLLNLNRWLIFVLVLTLSGCSGMYSSMRKVTYPQDFKYLEKADLRSDMGKMAIQVSLLDSALAKTMVSDAGEPELVRDEILSALNNISRIASPLQSGSAGSSHPFMEDFMGDFVSEVDKARVAASLAEPRYYFAGKVAGACASCHKVNR